jgi:hypothetical protein
MGPALVLVVLPTTPATNDDMISNRTDKLMTTIRSSLCVCERKPCPLATHHPENIPKLSHK